MGARVTAATMPEAHRLLVKECGGDAVERALARLPDAVREEWTAATPVGWGEADTVEAVFTEVARQATRDVAEVLVAITRAATERAFRTMWRILLRLTSDRALVTRAPLMHRKSFAQGELTAEVPQAGRGELRLSGWPDVSDFHLRSFAAGIAAVLELAGRRGVRCAWERAPGGARFALTWDRGAQP